MPRLFVMVTASQARVYPEMPDFALDGFIVKHTFIDVHDPSHGCGLGGRAWSLPPNCGAASSVMTLRDVRCRCFSDNGLHRGLGFASSSGGSPSSSSSDGEHRPAPGAGRQRADAASSGSRTPHGSARADNPAPPEGSDADSEGPMTTVMLRNLPEALDRGMLLEMLDANGFAACYDFLYLPIDFGSRCCFGYAFVNLVGPEEASRFMAHFQGFSRWAVPCDKVADVNWSGKRQGLPGQIDRYRNSPMMHARMPDEAKPIVLKDGRRVEFPPPTQAVKPLRVRPSKTRKAHNLGLDVICSEDTCAKEQ